MHTVSPSSHRACALLELPLELTHEIVGRLGSTFNIVCFGNTSKRSRQNLATWLAPLTALRDARGSSLNQVKLTFPVLRAHADAILPCAWSANVKWLSATAAALLDLAVLGTQDDMSEIRTRAVVHLKSSKLTTDRYFEMCGEFNRIPADLQADVLRGVFKVLEKRIVSTDGGTWLGFLSNGLRRLPAPIALSLLVPASAALATRPESDATLLFMAAEHCIQRYIHTAGEVEEPDQQPNRGQLLALIENLMMNENLSARLIKSKALNLLGSEAWRSLGPADQKLLFGMVNAGIAIPDFEEKEDALRSMKNVLLERGLLENAEDWNCLVKAAARQDAGPG